MMATTLVFAVSGLLMGILNAHQNFLLPALALSMNNIGLIIGALVIAPLIPTDSGLFAYNATQDASVYGLAFGAILGAVLHLAVQLPGLRKLDARLRFLPTWRASGVIEVLKLMIPRVFGLAVTRLNFLVSVFFASTMIAGSYTALNTAWFLMFFALGVIAQSMGTAVFPSLSSLAAEGDFVGFKQRLTGALRSVLFLAFPASVTLIVLGQPLIALVIERGAWTAEDTAGTAWALAFFAVGIAGHGALEVLSRAFYALSDTRTPVFVGVAALIANIVLSAVFIQFIGDPNSIARGAFAGLALSNSVTTLLEGVALGWLMRRRIGDFGDPSFSTALVKTVIAALAAGLVMYGASLLLWSSGALIVVVIAGAAGGAIFFGLAFAMGIKEARTIPAVLLGRIARRTV
jgi:putative peptidoglycan lipid II flippase